MLHAVCIVARVWIAVVEEVLPQAQMAWSVIIVLIAILKPAIALGDY